MNRKDQGSKEGSRKKGNNKKGKERSEEKIRKANHCKDTTFLCRGNIWCLWSVIVVVVGFAVLLLLLLLLLLLVVMAVVMWFTGSIPAR